MKTKLTEEDVLKGFELLGIDKTEAEVKDLHEKYVAMNNLAEQCTDIKGAIKTKIDEIEDRFKKVGITFKSDDIYSTAYFNEIELCKCENEWADIYDVTISTLDKIFKTFTSTNQTEESLKLRDKWYNLFYYSGAGQFMEEVLERLQVLNDELNEDWKKSIDLYSQLTKAQSEFYALQDSSVFEKYFAKRMQHSNSEKDKAVQEAREKHAKKVEEIIEFFSKKGIWIDNDEDIHRAFLKDADGNFVMLCSCDSEYEYLPYTILKELEIIKNALEFGEQDVVAKWGRFSDYFGFIDVKKLKEDFKVLDEEDKVLYKNYVDAETERLKADKEEKE